MVISQHLLTHQATSLLLSMLLYSTKMWPLSKTFRFMALNPRPSGLSRECTSLILCPLEDRPAKLPLHHCSVSCLLAWSSTSSTCHLQTGNNLVADHAAAGISSRLIWHWNMFQCSAKTHGVNAFIAGDLAYSLPMYLFIFYLYSANFEIWIFLLSNFQNNLYSCLNF